jgi:STE24 endopeptidase
MSEELIRNIILLIVLADFILERSLSFLNQKSRKKPIPVELEGIYNEEKYRKSQAYNRENSRFGLITSSISFILIVTAIYFGWFGDLDKWIRNFSPFDMLTTLIYFGFLFLILDVFGIPFELYRNFVIEEKYGFNKMKLRTYILDKVKGYLLTIIIGGLLLATLIYLVNSIGSGFWLYFWGIITVFFLFINMFYTSLILPLFNKLTPIEDGELKSSIEEFSRRVNFPLKNIFMMDGSKRSSKGNAFFSGLGKKKKVVLFDTLIEKHTTEELTAVFAHEVGHYKKKHIITMTIFSILQTGLMLFLLSRMIFNSEVSYALGGDMTAIHLNMLAFGLLYTPISHILGIIGNLLSRKHEYEADRYARENSDGKSLVSALKKMSSDHLSNLTPHPAYVFVHYSHPPLLQRVKALMSG